MRVFADRREAGRVLSRALERLREHDPVVLGLPRGGVPVAYEVAQALGAPLDVFVVRKLGVPWQPELAMGAIASGGVVVRNESVLAGMEDADEALERVRGRELEELERRERAYRGGRSAVPLAGRTVIVVDDGLATGSSMKAAVEALRRAGVERIVVAVPVGPPGTCRQLETIADDVICLERPAMFMAVGQWYQDFGQTGDEEVSELLRQASAGDSGHA